MKWTIALAALVAGCSPVLNAGLLRQTPVLSQDAEAPELALLHYRLTRDAGLGKLAGATICAGIGQGTGSTALPAAREEALVHAVDWVAPRSRCTLSPDKAFVDAYTGTPAVVVDVHELACEAPGNCTAWAGFYRNPRENGWSFYRLRFERGAWQISEEPLGIVLT